MQKITELCNYQEELMKKTKRIFAAVLAAATVLVSAGSPAVFAASGEAEASDSEEKDDAQAPSGYWAISNEVGGVRDQLLTKSQLNNYTGWVRDSANRNYYYIKGVKNTKTARIINGVRYTFKENGESNIYSGTYKGWTESARGRRYWNNGILEKDKWLLSTDGKYYYADENGYMTVGWSDVTRIGGAYSYFDEKGVWDGKVYWSKSNPEVTREKMLNERVRIKIKPVETIIGSDIKWDKARKQYLENNSSYELEIPLAAAETFSIGDTIIVRAGVTRGEKKDGVYDYYLTTGDPLYSYEPEDRNNSGVFDEWEITDSIQSRLGLFNELLLIRNDKLMLDRMFQVLGLSWEEIKGNKNFVAFVKDCHDGVYCELEEEAYALFGGYNPLDEETGLRVYRDGMSEEELITLMKKVNADVNASYIEDEETGSDTDYYDWVSNADGFWLEARIEEIPSVS